MLKSIINQGKLYNILFYKAKLENIFFSRISFFLHEQLIMSPKSK